MQHFQAAAGQGDAFATFNLGYMHMKGIGTPANATAAKASFEVAARKGIPAAFNGLGVLYFEGAGGGVVDYAAAQEAFVQGSALGDPDAMFNLATLHAGGALLLLVDSSCIAAQKGVRCQAVSCHSAYSWCHHTLTHSQCIGRCPYPQHNCNQAISLVTGHLEADHGRLV